MESLTSGTLAGTGSFRCEDCGYVVTLAAADALPDCPGCGGSRFTRASLFAGGRFQRRPGDEPTRGGARGPARRAPATMIESRASTSPSTTAARVRVVVARARVDAHRPQPGRRRALRRPDRLAPPRADRAPGRRRARARRPQPQRRVRQRRARRVARARATATRSSSAATACTSSSVDGGRSRDRRRSTAVDRSRPSRRGRRAGRGPGSPGVRPPASALPSTRRVAHTIAVLSQKGGTGKTTAVRTLTDVFRRAGPATSSPSTSTRRATCRTTSTSTPRRRADDRRRPHRAARRRPTPSTTTIIPANLSLAEAELQLAGKMGRELTLRKRAQGRRRRLRRHPHRLPAGARPADRQRARRRRLRAAQRRGAVLRAAGRRAGARGHRARARRPEPRPRVARRRLQHRRHAHRPLARGVRSRCRSTSATSCFDDRRPPVDRLRRVRRARGVDPRPPPRPRRRLPRARRRAARAPEARRAARRRLKPLSRRRRRTAAGRPLA